MDADIDEAVRALRAHGVVAYPTDTVYGLAASVFDVEAVRRVFAAKGRPPGQPLPIILADEDDLKRVAAVVPESAKRLARRFWPGPLTLVVAKHAAVPDIVTGGEATVAVRVPDLDLARELARRLGDPITATSANRHGQPPAQSAEEARAQLGDQVAYVLDGGPSRETRPSTILDLTVDPPRLLRVGPVSREALEAVLGVQVRTG